MGKKKKVQEENISEVILDDIDKFESFAKTYGNYIFITAGIIILAVVIGGIGYLIYANNRLKAISEIAEAKEIPELTKVIKKYPDYKETNEARLKLAVLYVREKKYKEALKNLQAVEKRTDVPEIVRWRAMMNIGYVEELKGDKKAAAEKFETLGASLDVPDVLRAEANYNSARIWIDLKNKDKAVRLLELAIKAASEPTKNNSFNNFWKNQSENLLNRLTKMGNLVMAKAAIKKTTKFSNKNSAVSEKTAKKN